MTRLSNGINVTEKVDASGAISLNGGERGIFVGGKVSSSGAIDIVGKVEILGPIKASGAIRIRSAEAKGDGKQVKMKLGTKVEASGSVRVEGNVESW